MGVLEINVLGRSEPIRFEVFDNELSMLCAREVLLGKTYPFIGTPPSSPTGRVGKFSIVDVGSNVGASCLYWLLNYPGAVVYGFEPHEPSYQLAKKNLQPWWKQVRLAPYALSDEEGPGRLYDGEADSVCCTLRANYPHAETSRIVRVENAGKHLLSLGLNEDFLILKVDTEGSESRILQSIARAGLTPQLVYVETHSREERRLCDSVLVDYHLVGAAVDEVERGVFVYAHKAVAPYQTIDKRPATHGQD